MSIVSWFIYSQTQCKNIQDKLTQGTNSCTSINPGKTQRQHVVYGTHNKQNSYFVCFKILRPITCDNCQKKNCKRMY